MDFKDCIKFANETPVCYLATADGDQPRVRALGFWFADETGFYFQIGAVKDNLRAPIRMRVSSIPAIAHTPNNSNIL